MLTIIQARTNSKRFRNKVLEEIYGKSLVQHVFERVGKSKKVSRIIVATSDKKTDDNLVKHLKKNKIEFYRGDLSNVSLRILKLLEKLKKKIFIRICCDSPIISYTLLNKAIQIHKKNPNKFDIITNVFPRSYPSGQSVELIKTNLLKENIKFFNKKDKEHVTTYFYRNKKNFKIKNFTMDIKKKYIKMSIDTKYDLKKLLSKFNTKKKFDNFKI
jgi:spore coat polysaccharide biosynthesis protein SpsF